MADLSRRAKIHVDSRHLIDLLQLPDDAEVMAVINTNDPIGFMVVVTKPDLPPVDLNAESPYLHSMVHIDANGKREVEYLWPKDES